MKRLISTIFICFCIFGFTRLSFAECERLPIPFTNQAGTWPVQGNRCYPTDAAGGPEDPLGSLVSGSVKRKTKELPEGRGLAIIDEAQLFLNSRHWEKNFPWIEFFTQHRKLGWDVFLIAHNIDMIDKQVRSLVEYETKLRNLKRVKLPFIPIHFPITLFQVVTRYSGLPENAKSSVHSKKLIPLFKPIVRLYKTMQVFSFNSPPLTYSRQGSDPLLSSSASSAASPSSEDFFVTRKSFAQTHGFLDRFI